MKISFKEEHADIVEKAKSVNIREIFGLIEWGAKDKERKEVVDNAISMLETYVGNYHHHEGKFVRPVMPIQRKTTARSSEEEQSVDNR